MKPQTKRILRHNAIRISTEVSDNAIVQTVALHGMNDIYENISREVVMIKEQHVRDALISLGWTPPEENNE